MVSRNTVGRDPFGLRKIVRKWWPLLLGVVMTFALAFPAAAAGQATRAVEMCGRLRAYSAPTGTAAGSVQIGAQTYPVAAGTSVGNGGVEISVGGNVCAWGSLASGTQQLVRLLFFPMLVGDRACGNIVLGSSPNIVIRSDFGELTLVPASGVGGDDGDQRVCYAFSVDPTSGALVATQKLVPRVPMDLERLAKCGRVNAYAPATSTTSGQIAIGSRSLRIDAGTTYTGDPAGDRTDRTKVGEGMCLSATLGPGGAIVQYLTRPIDTNIAGTAVQYTPPAGPGDAGTATLSYQSRFELVIPASLDATIDVARGTYCFSTSVDAAGDMAGYAVQNCSPGGVAGGTSATPAVSAPGSPTSSPTVSPTPTQAPSATALAISSPTPAPVGLGATPSIPIVLVVLLGAAALLVLVLGIRPRIR